jgi:Fe-S oxidoreductase
MALEEYKDDMKTCCRCSACKYVPLETLKAHDHVNVCPSITRYNYRAYSGGGRLGTGVALLEKKIDYSSKKLLEVVYNCQMCGACDVSCKYAMDMEVLDPLNEIRAECVKHGNTHPALDKLINSLKSGGPMVVGSKAKRGKWIKGLEVKDYARQKTQVIYHAGCRTCYDESIWRVAQNAVKLIQKAGVDLGVAYEESCCGGRAYQMGYQEEAVNQAKQNVEAFKKAGVKTLVTGCAECYFAFNVLYDKFGLKGELEVLHSSQFLARLIREGRLKADKPINMTVTYHDPCHLGRQGEPFVHWKGRRVPGQLIIFDPPKEFRRGTYGVYDAPRKVLSSIPGLKLVEMPRRKEYAWCCGAGGGVQETNPEYARWTAVERMKEAIETTSDALITGCPGCENLLEAAIRDMGQKMKIYDIVDVLAMSAL